MISLYFPENHPTWLPIFTACQPLNALASYFSVVPGATAVIAASWITDFSNNNLYMDVVQGLLAGGDAWCCNDASRWSEKLKGYEDDPQVVTAMRKATQNIMFAVANSNAMNGLTLNTTVVEVRGWWQDAFLYMDIGFGILTVLFLGLSIYSGKKAKKKADA